MYYLYSENKGADFLILQLKLLDEFFMMENRKTKRTFMQQLKKNYSSKMCVSIFTVMTTH